MSEVESLTIEILKQIRDEARGTNARLDQTNARLDQTNARLDQTREELSGRLDAVETTLREMAEQQLFLVRNAKRTAAREKKYERELDDLKQRVERLEDRADPKSS